MSAELRSEFLFQELSRLYAFTLPAILFEAGEVGQPRYIATAELPTRAVDFIVDGVHWKPGIYGTVDLTSLPEAGLNHTEFGGDVSIPSANAPQILQVKADSLDFSKPFSDLGYAKGVHGADAVRVSFGRALSQRLTTFLHATFSNSDGIIRQNESSLGSYDGHKAEVRFDYALNRSWLLRYRHFNTRNQAGVISPFFPEEWPNLKNGSHKEERLYHALELGSSALTIRADHWQIKEELNDPSRVVRHRVREAGVEASWNRQNENYSLSMKARASREEVRSSTIQFATRVSETLEAAGGLKILPRTWVLANAHAKITPDWPSAAALSASILHQRSKSFHLWARLGSWKFPPAIAERENSLSYLNGNDNLRAVEMRHAFAGAHFAKGNGMVELGVGAAEWRDAFVFASSSTGALLRNNNGVQRTIGLEARASFEPIDDLTLGFVGAHAIKALPRQFWFWNQPETNASGYLERRWLAFSKNLEIMPRLAARVIGERQSPVFSSGSFAPEFRNLRATALLDLQLRLRYKDGALLFSWDNLSDSRYSLRPGVQDAGRVFRWGFWWKFWN